MKVLCYYCGHKVEWHRFDNPNYCKTCDAYCNGGKK